MAKYVITAKVGNNGEGLSRASFVVRDVEAGKVKSFDLDGPLEVVQQFLKILVEMTNAEIKYK